MSISPRLLKPGMPRFLFYFSSRKYSEGTQHHPGEAAIISGLSYCSSTPKYYTIICSCSLHPLSTEQLERFFKGHRPTAFPFLEP